jgi:hypothetical protein
MKTGRFATMVTAIGLAAISSPSLASPSLSSDAPARPAALSVAPEDLPLTPHFAGKLTRYRNCVLKAVDSGMLGEQTAMARDAMSACALSRGELRSQLLADLRAAHPALNPSAALATAETGMAQLDPMIEAAAIDQAHLRYARDMH